MKHFLKKIFQNLRENGGFKTRMLYRNTSKPNEGGVSLFWDFLATFPYLRCCLQNAITFFYYLVPDEFGKLC